MNIPFTKPYMTGAELETIQQVLQSAKLSGNGPWTQKCHKWLIEKTQTQRALLTQSCTSALEMSALLLNLQPGDEVIMPSFTFVSSANAFVLRGAVPVFVDIRPDTLNLDERKVEAALSPRTRAIIPVHYAGVAVEMDALTEIARHRGVSVVADSAQAIQSLYKGRSLPALGDLSALSFHDTKNISSGEGGALLVNNSQFLERAEILWEKGTNRSRFLRGEVDKYTWVDLGSSFLPSEITAGLLWAQLNHAEQITHLRLQVWEQYYHHTHELEQRGYLRRPTIPAHCTHNGHMFYVLLHERFSRTLCIEHLKAQGVQAVSHYVPLHSSPAGRRLSRTSGELTHTDTLSESLLRLPLWPNLGEVERVVHALREFLVKADAQATYAPRGVL